MSLDLSRIRAICFDVDGTLSDTDDRWVHRLSRMLLPIKILWPEKDFRPLARRIIMEIETPGNFIYHILDRAGLDDEAGKVINMLSRIKGDASMRNFWIVPGVGQAIEALKDHFPLAVVSARGEKSTLAFLQQFELHRFFTVVVTAQTCAYTKPFPDPIIFAARKMEVHPQECLMVGDTPVDIRAGKAAGAQTAGVLCGFGTESELLKAGADLILPSPVELLNVLPARETGKVPG